MHNILFAGNMII